LHSAVGPEIQRQPRRKNSVPLAVPVTSHARHDLEGSQRSYTDSSWMTSNWPVLCSNPDCREVVCKRVQKNSYHWDLDWKSGSPATSTQGASSPGARGTDLMGGEKEREGFDRNGKTSVSLNKDATRHRNVVAPQPQDCDFTPTCHCLATVWKSFF
jgi:hypothetical protein